jgi:hypothetical protein
VDTTGLALWAIGAVLVMIGYARARAPWRRYQALRDEAANERRYADWRGGVRSSGTTGADVAMAMFRRRAQAAAAIAVVGAVLIFLGFFLG